MADDEAREIVIPEMAVPVRETQLLFRLTQSPEKTAGGPCRQTVIVAAVTKDEARRLAALHDPLRRDWQDPAFAVAEAQQTEENHMVGDVVFRSEPAAPLVGKRADTRFP